MICKESGKMDIGMAVANMLAGNKCARTGWNKSTTWIAMANFAMDHKGDVFEPFVYLHTEDGKRIPWNPTQSDIFATDWIKV